MVSFVASLKTRTPPGSVPRPTRAGKEWQGRGDADVFSVPPWFYRNVTFRSATCAQGRVSIFRPLPPSAPCHGSTFRESEHPGARAQSVRFDANGGEIYTPKGHSPFGPTRSPAAIMVPMQPASEDPIRAAGGVSGRKLVHETITTAEIQELAQDGSAVLTTVYEFPAAKIRLSTKKDLVLITVSGSYSRTLAKEIEKLAGRFKSNIGLEFKAARPSDEKKGASRFDSSIGTLLRNLQSHCERNKKTFLLCSPPQELLDALKLLGVDEEYSIAGSLAASATERQLPAKLTKEVPNSAPSQLRAHKRIFQLNQSLKRTVKLEKGLDSAAKCIQKLLPQKPPVARGYEFAFFYRSSEKVGGDFFDFIPLDDDTLGIAIGDVAGHGIDAALVMGISKKLINVRAKDPRFSSPRAVLWQVHRDFRGDFSRSTFLTALYGRLRLSSGTFEFARAGHEFPIFFRPGGRQKLLKTKGTALGLGNDKQFGSQIEEASIILPPDSFLFLCTDGLIECRAGRGSFYTRDRLLFELGCARPGESSKHILGRVLNALERFAEGHPQEDDMTAILIRKLPEGQATNGVPGREMKGG